MFLNGKVMIPFHFHSMQYRFKLQTQLFSYEFSQRAKEVKEKDQGHSADRTMSFKKTITKNLMVVVMVMVMVTKNNHKTEKCNFALLTVIEVSEGPSG